MTMPELEPGLEPEDHDAVATAAPAERRSRRRALMVILLPIALVLGLLGGAFGLSVGRSSGPDPAARAQSARIAAWAQGSASQIAALRSGSKTLAADVRRPNLAALSGDANQLRAAVTAADSLPQVPDTSGNADWETALAAYSSAVQSALAAAGGSNPQELANAAELLGAGDTQLVALDERVRTLGG
jgi:hypothetical protein